MSRNIPNIEVRNNGNPDFKVSSMKPRAITRAKTLECQPKPQESVLQEDLVLRRLKELFSKLESLKS